MNHDNNISNEVNYLLYTYYNIYIYIYSDTKYV